MDCWAACLDECGGGVSREHYISDGIFDEKAITAFGLSWCKEKPLTIGLASAVSKILCKKHNEAVSQFDREAAKLSRFLSANILDDPLARNEVTLDGALLERWSLKTLLNLGYIGALDQENFVQLQPPPEIVKSLFQNAKVPDGIGLYFVTGSTITNQSYKNELSWDAIRIVSNSNVLGMTFTFNGIRFVVSIVPVRLEEKIAKMGVVKGVDYSRAKIVYRPASIVLSSNTAGRKVVNLKW